MICSILEPWQTRALYMLPVAARMLFLAYVAACLRSIHFPPRPLPPTHPAQCIGMLLAVGHVGTVKGIVTSLAGFLEQRHAAEGSLRVAVKGGGGYPEVR